MNSNATRTPRRPRIVITLADITRAADPVLTDDKNELYIAAIRRAGGDPLPLNERSTEAQRKEAFAAMDGLLLSGGEDVDPARYGRPMEGARNIQPERDQLEVDALAAADADGLPVLGICRGLQALNAFKGGTLLQHVDGHETPDPLLTGLARHDLEIRPGSRLAGILLGRGTDDPAGRDAESVAAPEVAPRLVVNSYHHQGVAPEGLAPGMVSSGTAEHPGGILVEAFETSDSERFLIGIQCHPERLTSTPPAFGRLFRAFVQAAARD
jgi:putative glutamine amidotransferase